MYNIITNNENKIVSLFTIFTFLRAIANGITCIQKLYNCIAGIFVNMTSPNPNKQIIFKGRVVIRGCGGYK
jgi:hypothetical protein